MPRVPHKLKILKNKKKSILSEFKIAFFQFGRRWRSTLTTALFLVEFRLLFSSPPAKVMIVLLCLSGCLKKSICIVLLIYLQIFLSFKGMFPRFDPFILKYFIYFVSFCTWPLFWKTNPKGVCICCAKLSIKISVTLTVNIYRKKTFFTMTLNFLDKICRKLIACGSSGQIQQNLT